MATQTPPWLLMRRPDSKEELLASLTAMPSDPQPVPVQAPLPVSIPRPSNQTKDMVVPPKTPAPGETQSVMTKTTTTSLPPQTKMDMEGLRDQIEGIRKDRLSDEQKTINDYQAEMDKYKNASQGVDFRGLASLLDRFGDGSTTKLAESMKPESPEEKQMKLLALKEKLSGMKGNLTTSQLAALKDQLASLTAEKNSETAEKRLSASMNSKQDSQVRLRDRDDDKDLQEFQKRIQPFQKVDNTLNGVEGALGFNLNEYDSSTGSVRGEKADAPGVTVPILGRINQATPESRQFKAALARLTNTVLKERSGAAVTESEEQRMLSEFANGRYRFNTEADLLNTLKSYGQLLEADKKDVMAGFRPEIAQMYYNRKGLASDYKRSGGVAPKAKKKAPTSAEIDAMTPEQLKEYLGE